MYQIKIDFKDSVVVIPMDTVAALKFPDIVNFVYNREQGIIGLAKGAVEVPGTGTKRGRQRDSLEIRLSKIWDSRSNCFLVESNRTILNVLGERIPDRDPQGSYILNGDFIFDSVIGFNVGDAVLSSVFHTEYPPIEETEGYKEVTALIARKRARQKEEPGG